MAKTNKKPGWYSCLSVPIQYFGSPHPGSPGTLSPDRRDQPARDPSGVVFGRAIAGHHGRKHQPLSLATPTRPTYGLCQSAFATAEKGVSNPGSAVLGEVGQEIIECHDLLIIQILSIMFKKYWETI